MLVLVLRMLLLVLLDLVLVRMGVVQRRTGRVLLLVLEVVMIAITTLRPGLEDVRCALLVMILQAGIEVLFSSSSAHLPPVLVLLLLVLQEGIGTTTAAAGTSTHAQHPRRRRIPLRWRRRMLLLRMLLRMLRVLPMGARPRTIPPSPSTHRDGLGLLERDGLGVVHGRLVARGGATAGARAPALLATSGGTVRRRTHPDVACT